MKYPNDDTMLVMSDRQGIEIDHCPQCRGVWLDRGELDKIIDRTGPSSSRAQSDASNQATKSVQGIAVNMMSIKAIIQKTASTKNDEKQTFSEIFLISKAV